MLCLSEGLQTFPNCISLCWLTLNVSWYARSLIPYLKLFLKLSVSVSVKFYLPHGSEVWLIAGDGCLWEILVYFDAVLGRVVQRGPISLCPLGSGQPILHTRCTRASRVCNVWMAVQVMLAKLCDMINGNLLKMYLLNIGYLFMLYICRVVLFGLCRRRENVV